MKNKLKSSKGTSKFTPEPTVDELRERMAQIAEQERAFAASCPDTKTYLSDIQSRHENPYFIAYEVVEMAHMSVILTTENYAEASNAFNERFKQDRQARLDIVVREVKTGVPLFRQTVMELSDISCERHGMHYMSDDYGRFGPSVYNHIFRDAKWAGYETYTRPTKTFNFQWEP